MITREREEAGIASPPQPPAGGGPGWHWWQSWQPEPGRPQPINRRNLLRGSVVALPIVALVDGLLGVMAYLATGRPLVGLAVWFAMFCLMALELGIVVWATRRRQQAEARRAD